MAELLVRDLDDRLINALKRRAARMGRSTEAEHRAILQTALQDDIETFPEMSARLRAEKGRVTPSSEEILRSLRGGRS